MFNLYADVDARSMTPSRNRRSYTLRSVPSSPGRSFLTPLLPFTQSMSKFSSSVVSVLANISHKLLIFCWLLIGFHAIDECTVSRLQADSPGRDKQVMGTIKPPVSASKRRFILPQRA